MNSFAESMVSTSIDFGRKSRVLVVDDDISLAKSFKQFFELKGYFCDVAHSVKSAVEKLHNGQYDLVTLDIQLPDGTGFFVLEKIRIDQDPKIRNVLVLGVSGKLVEEQDKIDFIRMGGDDFMFKPVMMDTLVERVRNLLSKKGMGS